MLQALIWFVFYAIVLVGVSNLPFRSNRLVLFVFMVFFATTLVCGFWLLREVVVFLWPYAIGVK